MKHTFTTFAHELEDLKTRLMEMADILMSTLKVVVEKIDTKQNIPDNLVEHNAESIYQMELEIEKTCNEILALRQPTARDLRFVVAVSRIASEFEDIARHLDNLIRYYTKIIKYESPESIAESDFLEIKSMLTLTTTILGTAISSFSDYDLSSSLENISISNRLDEQYKNSTRIIVSKILENPNFVRKYLNTFWILYSLDRICEYARNVSLHVIFIVRGSDVRHMSSKKIMKLVVDDK